jgi:mono/diheme cytochrome c family protein|eukprot:TRINITY_DN59345_c0_g1_i1.p1 TRINITY_DN59345_c0_g1~~TRINITY_DN59345_c0_g1_i1.p1  ORF type:complete len:185 (-),score=17.96 TRINITY_DN59345_c0_g1_i1:27-581(-)
MMRNRNILAAAGMVAMLLCGCTSPPDNAAGSASTTGAPPPSTGAPAPAPAPAPVAVSTPTVAAAPDLEFDKAKAMKGYADVKKIGKNPHAGDIEATKAGATLFATNCASCHGPEGHGDGPAGMSLNPKPRNLTAFAEYKYGKGDLGLFRTVKYGVDGSGMAPWEGRMTDDECWKVVNFVRTLQK